MRWHWPTVILLATVAACSGMTRQADPPALLDIRGVTFAHLHRRGVGYGSEPARRELDRMAVLGVNWIALNDFAYMPDVTGPVVAFGRDRSMTRDDLRRQIADAHNRGIKVLLKPHIWASSFWDGKWHGDIRMDDEAEWAAFFDNYTAYILDQAKLAAETGADGLSVGVEMKGASGREEDWRRLVAKVREVYDGPVTYSANSDEWPDVAWWDALDVVGITAYFPLAEGADPTDADLRAGWAGVYDRLDAFHAEVGLPIVFTELGYSASDTAAREPWRHDEQNPDTAFQARLYRVALEEAARRDYVAGVFLWKWFTADTYARHEGGDVFVFQDRPETLAVLAKAFGGEMP